MILEEYRNICKAIGLTKIMLNASLAGAIVQVILIYPALYYFGIEGAAVILVLSSGTQLLVYLPKLKESIDLRYKDILSVYRPAIVSALFVVLGVVVLGKYVHFNGVIGVLAKIFTSVAAYIVVYGSMTGWKIIRDTRELIVNQRAS